MSQDSYEKIEQALAGAYNYLVHIGENEVELGHPHPQARLLADVTEARRLAALRASGQGAEPFCFVIPGDNNASDKGFIDAMICSEGEFTRPLYTRPAPAASGAAPDDSAAPCAICGVVVGGSYCVEPRRVMHSYCVGTAPDGWKLIAKKAVSVFVGCANDYLHAVEALGKIVDGKTLFEHSPSKNQECFEAWVRLNNAGVRLRECIRTLGQIDATPASADQPVEVRWQDLQAAAIGMSEEAASSFYGMCVKDGFQLPDRIVGYATIDMRLLAERVLKLALPPPPTGEG